MSNALSLQVTLEAIDRLTSPLKAIKEATSQLSAAMSKNRDKIRDINRQLNDIQGYEKQLTKLKEIKAAISIQQAVVNTSNNKNSKTDREIAKQTEVIRLLKEKNRVLTENGNFDENRAKASQYQLNLELKKLKDLERQNIRYRNTETRKLQKLTEQHQNLTTTVNQQAATFKKAGISVDQFGAAQKRLRAQVNKTNRELKVQDKHLKLRGEAQAHYDKSRAVNDSLKGKSLGAYYFGRRAMAGLSHPLEVYNEYQQVVNVTRSQGLSDEQIHLAQTFSEKAGLFGQSQTENLKHWAEAYAITVDNHHASEAAALMGKLETGLKYLSASGSIDEKARDGLDKLPNALLKIAEIRGDTDPDKLSHIFNLGMQSYGSTQTMVNANEYLDFMKFSGFSGKMINADVLFGGMSHLIQETSGAQVGTALSTAYESLIKGRIKEQKTWPLSSAIIPPSYNAGSLLQQFNRSAVPQHRSVFLLKFMA